MQPTLAKTARHWLRGSRDARTGGGRLKTVRLSLESLEARDLLSWSPFADWAPQWQVKATTVGANPANEAGLPYVIGLNDYVYTLSPGGPSHPAALGQATSISAPRLFYQDTDGNTYAAYWIVRKDDSQVYYARCAIGHTCIGGDGQWSSYIPWAPNVLVKTVSVGYDPVTGGLAVFAIGLDDMLYQIPRNGLGQPLVGGRVLSISASQNPQIAGESWIFAVGLNNEIYLAEGDTSGNWSGYFAWAPNIKVKEVSPGVEPFFAGNLLEVYAVGLDDSLYSIDSGGPQHFLAQGPIYGISTDQSLEDGNAAFVFAVSSVTSDVVFTVSSMPPPVGSANKPTGESDQYVTSGTAGWTDPVVGLFLEDSSGGSFGKGAPTPGSWGSDVGHWSAGRSLDVSALQTSAAFALDRPVYDLI